MEIFIPRDVKDMNDMIKQCNMNYIVSPFMLKSYGIATIEATKILYDNKVDVIFDITGLIAIVAKKMNLDIKISKHSPYKDKIINMTTKEFDFYDHNINDLIYEVMLGINQGENIEINEKLNSDHDNKYFYGQEVKVRKCYLPTWIYNDYPSIMDEEYITGFVSYIERHGCTVTFIGKDASLPYNYIEKADFYLGDKCYVISRDNILTNRIVIIQNIVLNDCLVSLPDSRGLFTYQKKYLVKLNEVYVRRWGINGLRQLSL